MKKQDLRQIAEDIAEHVADYLLNKLGSYMEDPEIDVEGRSTFHSQPLGYQEVTARLKNGQEIAIRIYPLEEDQYLP